MLYKLKKIRVAMADKNMVVARPFYTGRHTLEQLASDIAYASTLSKGDVTAVLSAFSKVASTYLENGHPVSLGRMGVLRPSVKCKAVEEQEQVSADFIERVKIIFSPSNEMKDALKTMPLERFTPGSCIVGNYAINGSGVTDLSQEEAGG